MYNKLIDNQYDKMNMLSYTTITTKLFELHNIAKENHVLYNVIYDQSWGKINWNEGSELL